MTTLDWIAWGFLMALNLFGYAAARSRSMETRAMIREVKAECHKLSALISECDKVLAMYDDFNARRLRQKIEEARVRIIERGQQAEDSAA